MLDATYIGPETIRPLRRAEYEHMTELGWFDDERVELLQGFLVTMSPQSEPHARVIMLLTRYLNRSIEDDAEVRPQLPLAVSNDSVPEPDIAVVRQSKAGGRPTSALLVVEVAEQRSLPKDRGVKAALYAAAGVPEYWIVNLAAGTLEVYTGPGSDGYQSMVERRPGDTVELMGLPGVRVPVDVFLP